MVVLSAVAAGLGSGARSVGGILFGTVAALIGWYVWAYLAYWIGTRLLPEAGTRATHGELLRTVGFASAPGLLRILGLLPALRGVVFLAAAVWMLVTTVLAVRQALDFRSIWRALAVTVIGWLVQGILLALALWLMGAPAAAV
ncbi:MAG: YIP1 family protein [Candidatus Rokuibacteriota bacterium]